MMRFVIADGLPYLLHNNKTYAVRWDEKGFTVGAEVKLASVPAVTLSELSVKAKYPHALDSIGKQEQPEQVEQEEDHTEEQPEQVEQEEDHTEEQPEQVDELDKMTVLALKAYASKHGIELGDARKKAEILQMIRGVKA